MWSDVALVLAGAVGAAITGVLTSLFHARTEHRAFRRTRLAAWLDRDRELLGEYLLAVDDLASALISWVDELIVQPLAETPDDEVITGVIDSRRQHERLWHQVALRVPDELGNPLVDVSEAVAAFYSWVHEDMAVLTKEARDAHSDAVDDAVQKLIDAARTVYSNAETDARLM